ncbi:MAG: cobalamin-binding protein [Nevskia sp.]|nr:cobalamin-binding protein [Nevskia sp.]
MKPHLFRRGLAALFLTLSSSLAHAGAPPQRVVTLAPHLTELVCAVGACGRLVGVSAYSDYPAQVKDLPQVSDAATVNLEAVLGLKPDLVLAWDGGTAPETVARLRGLGLRVEPLRVRGLEDVAAALEETGALLGSVDAAHQAAQAYRARLAQLRARWRGAAPIRTVYQIETAPAYTINRDSPISEAMALCGGVNVFADLPRLAAPVSAEAMLAARPEAVLYGGEENAQAIRDYWARLAGAPAARTGNLYAVDANLLARATPRLLDGVEQVCTILDQARAHREKARAQH